MMSTLLVLAAVLNCMPVPPLPAMTSWLKVQEYELEVRANDYETLFVGVVTDYRNPADAGEIVRVFAQYAPIISLRSKKSTADGPHSSIAVGAVAAYHRTAEEKALERAHQSVDVFACIRWKTAKDPVTDLPRSLGPMEFWLLDQTGSWAYANSASGGLVQTPLSEPWVLRPARRIMVGIVFTLGEKHRVLRVDQGVLALLALQKKENSHAK